MAVRLLSFFSRLVDIRPHERIKTFVMFFYFFSIIATIWMLKPVRNSLFLDELGSKNLRYIYIGEGLFLIGLVWAFVQFSKRLNKKTLYNGALGFFILCLLGFWYLFRTGIPYLSALFYVWAASYSIIMTTQFFTLANDIFNPLEAKRLFGFILSGGSIGGVLGGILTQQLVGRVGTENLLLVIAAVIALCNVLVMSNWKHLIASDQETVPGSAAENHGTSRETAVSGKKLLLGSSYLMMLAAVIMIAKIASTIVDNQFNAIVELSIAGKDARTAFYGGFFSFLNALSFFMQLFLTSLVFRYLGVGIALWILPGGLLLGAAAAVASPVLAVSIFLKIFDGSTNYSIQQASKEVLYLPIASAVRYKVKPVIDMLGYRIAKSLGGVYIAVAAPLLSIPDRRLSDLVLWLLPLWFWFVWKLRTGYSTMLRSNLMVGAKEIKTAMPQQATDVLGTLYNEKTFESIKNFLGERSPYIRKLASAAYLLYLKKGKNYEATRRAIEGIVRRETFETSKAPEATAEKDLALMEDWLLQTEKGHRDPSAWESDYPEEALIKIGEILRSSGQNHESKRRAVRLLELIPRQEVVDLLISNLGNIHNHALRFAITKALDHLHQKNGALLMNRFLIKNEISREVILYESLNALRIDYARRTTVSERADYLDAILKAIQDESFDRVFMFLDLLYPHETIRIIHDRIVEYPPNHQIRAHATELLHNTLDRDLMLLVQRILEEVRPEKVSEREIVGILRDFICSQDQWFYLLGMFLSSDSGLDKQWPELKALVERNEHQII